MRPLIEKSRPRRPLLGEYSSTITGPDWTGYVPIRVKSVRVAAFDAIGDHLSAHLQFAKAAGAIELVGGRIGSHFAELHVGFSLADVRPTPTFHLTDSMAVGTLVLPGHMLSSWLLLLNRQAFFRIGGDGLGNAISSDVSFWG